MSGDEKFDPKGMAALVLDPNDFQRNISIDQLRMMGCRRALAAKNVEEAWDLLVEGNPDIVLLEWLERGDVLEFVRRIRLSESAPNNAVSIFILSSRATANDVERARAAGVNGFLRKPMSTLTLKRWVQSVTANPRPFVITESYVGPCRRRKQDPLYGGPKRRLTDSVEGGNDEEVDLKAQLARARVAALDAAARAFQPGDSAAARKVFQAAKDLSETADQIGDTILSFGCREMMRYLQAQGATSRLDPEVVRTHVAALHQVAHLPVAMADAREQVAQSLKRMVDKKLRQLAS